MIISAVLNLQLYKDRADDQQSPLPFSKMSDITIAFKEIQKISVIHVFWSL